MEDETVTEIERKHIDALIELPLWWGYLHVIGSVHVKRFFDNRDLHEAHESAFVSAVCTPMPCEDRQDALNKFHKKFGIPQEEKTDEI